jgi:hypothetical protein
MCYNTHTRAHTVHVTNCYAQIEGNEIPPRVDACFDLVSFWICPLWWLDAVVGEVTDVVVVVVVVAVMAVVVWCGW